MKMIRGLMLVAAVALLAGVVVAEPAVRPVARPDSQSAASGMRPVARTPFLPDTRWAHKEDSDLWTRAAMTAVAGHGPGLDTVEPRDIAAWCPAYPRNTPQQRRAFWVGMMSALARYESTYRPEAVGGGGRWFGLLQISPATARHYGCRARTGRALLDPVENLSCAARIMARTVARDRAVALHDGRWRGVAADWGPMTRRAKRDSIAAWTRAQSYCQIRTTVRPRMRPAVLMVTAAEPVSGLPQSD